MNILSGKDERKIFSIPDCPTCRRRPRHWTLGRSGHIPMCQMYSRIYSLGKSHSGHIPGTTLFFYSNNACMNIIEHRITYGWCRECETFHEDKAFVKKLVNVAKQLEKLSMWDNDEW